MAKAAKSTDVEGEDEEDLVGGEGETTEARPNKITEVSNAAARKLKGYIARIERFDGERQGLVDDIKGVYKEIKAAGYETKVVRKLVAERKKDAAAQEEFEQLLDLYRHALGMTPATAPAAEA